MSDSRYTPDNEFAPRADLVLIASRSGSPNRSANARKLETVMRERITRIDQRTVGIECDIEQTAMHRIVSGRRGVLLSEMYDFMAALGLGVIECDDPEMVSLPREEYEALRTLSRQALAQIADPRGQADE